MEYLYFCKLFYYLFKKCKYIVRKFKKKIENWVFKFVFVVNCRINMLKVYLKDNGKYFVFRNVYCI